jgi:hypothetical protein
VTQELLAQPDGVKVVALILGAKLDELRRAKAAAKAAAEAARRERESRGRDERGGDDRSGGDRLDRFAEPRRRDRRDFGGRDRGDRPRFRDDRGGGERGPRGSATASGRGFRDRDERGERPWGRRDEGGAEAAAAPTAPIEVVEAPAARVEEPVREEREPRFDRDRGPRRDRDDRGPRRDESGDRGPAVTSRATASRRAPSASSPARA